MNSFYEWLYENYAKPRLSNALSSPVYLAQRREWGKRHKSCPGMTACCLMT